MAMEKGESNAHVYYVLQYFPHKEFFSAEMHQGNFC